MINNLDVFNTTDPFKGLLSVKCQAVENFGGGRVREDSDHSSIQCKMSNCGNFWWREGEGGFQP